MDPNDINEKELNKEEKDTKRKTAKVKAKVTGVIIGNFIKMAIIPMLKILLVLSLVTLAFEGINWILEKIFARNISEETLTAMEVESLEELVEIKGNPETGYYIGYVDGFDQKLEELAKRTQEEHNLKSTETDTIEKMIRAQLITQFPNLGGEVGGEDDGTEKVGLSTDNSTGSGASSFTSLDGFLFIGDSITVGVEASGSINNATFRAVQSSTPEQWLNNKSVNGQATYSTLPENSDDITALCVMLGTNNLEQVSEMEQLLEKLHEKYSDKTIFVQKIWSWGSYQDQVNNYNSAIESFCDGKDYCVYIDATSNIELPNPSDPHLTANGYSQFAENIKNAITSSSVPESSTETTEEQGSEEENSEEQTDEELEPSKYEGFQGSVKIRRVTPDKDRGELKDTGGGEISVTDNSTLQAGTAIETEIKKYIDKSGASGNWSVYAKNLETNEVEININNQKMQSASLIKLFIMASVFDEIKNGEINLDDVSSDLEIMITESDNDATNRLIDLVGFDKINTYIKTNQYSNTEINRKMLEENSDGDNYTSVSDVARILERINEGTCVNQSSSARMLEYLKNQKRTSKIPAGVPDGVETANKTGELDDVQNDAAIVYKENNTYILVVMSEDLDDTDKAIKNIKRISSKVYEAMGGEEAQEKHIVAIDAGHGDSQYAGDYSELATSEEDLQNGKKYYTSGTTGTAVDGSVWKEADAVQTVVDRVKEIMAEKYPSIEVVQTGKDQPNFRRIDLAKEAGAEAYIGVHLNSNDDNAGNGSEVYIRPGEGNEESKEFGQYIVDAVDNALNIKNNGVNAELEENTRGLKTYDECEIPNIYIEGAYMNSSDMKVVGSNEGLEKYAQGIVEGIAQYFGLSTNSDYEQIGITKESSAVGSRIYDLYFVPTDTFNEYVSNNDSKALECFTLDTSGKLITAKWSYTGGELKITKNSPINFRTVLSKYVTTYEYLMDYWIDIKEEDFILAFANKVLESEFIITIEDNVTTTETTVRTLVDTSMGGHTESSTTTLSETVSNEIELSYVDTWFVKFSKDYDFSDATIASTNGDGVMYTGTQGDKIADFTITAYCACEECCGEYSKEAGGEGKTASGTIPRQGVTIASNNFDLGTYVMFNNHVYKVEDTGSGLPGYWIDIYFDSHEDAVQWGVQHYPVFWVDNVQEMTSNVIYDSIVLGIASVPGKVSDNTSHSESQVSETQIIKAPVYSLGDVPALGESTVFQDIPVTVTTTTITDTHTISNKYDTGEANVTSKEDEFIDLFENYPDAQGRLKPKWLVGLIEENAAHMTDITKFLLNELFNEEIFDDIDKDKIFEKFKDNEFKQSSGVGVDISLTTSVLDRATFIEALQSYYDKTGNISFKENFLSRAGEIYDLGEKYNVNPELVVTMALKESGFKSSGGNQNFWGLGTPNGASLAWIGSFEEGVKQLANSFANYMEGSGTWHEQEILNRYEERMAANCNSNGYGKPGTLKGMLSIYSDLCGENTKHREGNAGDGGNYYLKVIYGDEFEAKCGSVHRIGVDDYTIQEKADYTAWLYENQLKYWNDIFGDFATLGGSGGNVRAVCEEITQMLIDRNARYGAYTYNNIQKTYESDPGVVCASYVALVLYKSGLMTEDQINSYNYHYTVDFPNMLAAAGWTVVDKSDLQPGDVLNKPGEGNNGHAVIYVGDGLIYDQTSAVWSSSGSAPTGKPKSVNGYLNGYTAWRAPS